jgi:hypothetical protein
MHDRRVSEGLKKQASELEQLLAERERAFETLKARHRDFMTQHQGDIAELDRLREQAKAIDDRLSDSRRLFLESSRAEINAFKRGSASAASMAESLRATYMEERREKRRR